MQHSIQTRHAWRHTQSCPRHPAARYLALRRRTANSTSCSKYVVINHLAGERNLLPDTVTQTLSHAPGKQSTGVDRGLDITLGYRMRTDYLV